MRRTPRLHVTEKRTGPPAGPTLMVLTSQASRAASLTSTRTVPLGLFPLWSSAAIPSPHVCHQPSTTVATTAGPSTPSVHGHFVSVPNAPKITTVGPNRCTRVLSAQLHAHSPTRTRHERGAPNPHQTDRSLGPPYVDTFSVPPVMPHTRNLYVYTGSYMVPSDQPQPAACGTKKPQSITWRVIAANARMHFQPARAAGFVVLQDVKPAD